LLLELPEFGPAVERVIAFGRPTLSRPVTRMLNRPEVDVVLVSVFGHWPDPGRPVRRFARVDLGDRPRAVPAADDWLIRWRDAGAAAGAAIDAALDAEAEQGRISGPLLAREVSAALRPQEVLVAAASNPIRDLDLAARPLADPAVAVHANRGLSGIDGTLSTALGVALNGGSVRVLVGDVAFLHDVGALLGAPDEQRPDLQVVVLNDDGGGIFSLLEYGELAEADPTAAAQFDRLFGTPHGADLAALCRGFGVPHERVDDVGRLRAVLADPPPGLSVVEVPASRSTLRHLHTRLREAVCGATQQ
jgi:2-succinyl-5-enolpyruvyl-6-hydroxy-3-cyclohexene-1-carboxylate synthase